MATSQAQSRAHADLEGLGVGHHTDEAARELRRLGVRVSRSERPAAEREGLDSLSAREREISDLVATGRRNAEIAESLFLSVRTVEGHLRRVFSKLGISSRTQLTALVRERS